MLVSFLTVFNLTMQRLLLKKNGTIRKYAKRTKRGGKRTFAEGKLFRFVCEFDELFDILIKESNKLKYSLFDLFRVKE